MASMWLLTSLMLVAMFTWTMSGSLSYQDLQDRCQKNRTAIFAHPGQCQLYYNCSNDVVPGPRYPLPQFMEECHYPQLFSAETSRCHDFEDVTCGDRVENVDQCQYFRSQCGSAHCAPCILRHPSCRGLADGKNEYRGKEGTPNYVICYKERTVATHLCPKNETSQTYLVFDQDSRQCISPQNALA